MSPKVSVVVPTHRRPALLAEALASVAAQTVGDWECIVADDRSGRETEAMLECLAADDPRFVVLRVEAGTPARARNAALARCRGELVAFLDDDDLWLPDKLEAQLAAFDPDAILVCSRIEEFGAREARWPAGEVPREITFERMLEGNLVATSTAIVRRRDLDVVGGFDETLAMAEDYELWLRLARRGRVRFVDRVLCRYRVHPGNVSGDEARMLRHVDEVMRLLRRRGDIGWRTLRRRLRATSHRQWELAGGPLERLYWRLRRGYYFGP